MHESKFEDFGLTFEILEKDKPPSVLQKKFDNEISKTDPVLFSYYQNIVKNYDSKHYVCLLYTSPSPRDNGRSRMPSSA